MRLHKTGHPIADTVSDLIGDLEDGNYKIAYGILRHDLFHDGKWFEVDKGFWGSDHYSGNYRISFNGTQPIYRQYSPLSEPHGQTLEPWRDQEGYTLVCPPTGHVCDFFEVSLSDWMITACALAGPLRKIRHKGDEIPIEWSHISEVITFNSTVGFEALKRGIPVISDPVHSAIGSYQQHCYDNGLQFDREKLFSFASGHQFRLSEKEKICNLIRHYLHTSDGMTEKL